MNNFLYTVYMLAHDIFKSETFSVILFLATEFIYIYWYC
jgi:hypothetical protein